MDTAKKRIIERKRRAERVRKSIYGTPERPRLCIRRSLKHIYAQIIDDVEGKTIAQVVSYGKHFTADDSGTDNTTKVDVSRRVGELIADMAKEKGISEVVFDRKGYIYHGRVKALADGARSNGLKF